jgi:hypothetical protein
MVGPVVIVRNVFSLVGILLLGGASLWVYATQRFISKAEKATGTVVEMVPARSSKGGTTWSPVVEFTTPEGKSVRLRPSFSSSPPAYDVGEKVEVFYRPEAPEKAKLDGFFALYLGPIILGGVGFIFFSVGSVMRWVAVLQERKEDDLRQNGLPVQTQVQAVRLNTSLAVNGRNPFQVVTQWLDPGSGKIRVFHSANLWFDPTSYAQGREITVFLDRKRPKRYFMDLSFLPEVE